MRWSPEQIDGSFSWWDFGFSGNTLVGSKISVVLDRGSEGWHAVQGTDASRFTRLSAAQNGNDTASVSSGNFMSISAPQYAGQDVFVVYKIASAATGYRLILHRNDTNAPGVYAGISGANYKPGIFYQSNYAVSASGSADTWQFAQFRLGSTIGSSYVRYADEVSPVFNTTPASGYSIWSSISLSSTQQFVGEIGEIIMLNFSANDYLRRYIGGYLADRWGLKSLLPSGHAFKTLKPSVRPVKSSTIVV